MITEIFQKLVQRLSKDKDAKTTDKEMAPLTCDKEAGSLGIKISMHKSGSRSVDLRKDYCMLKLFRMHPDLYVKSIQNHLDLYSDYMSNISGRHAGYIRNQSDYYSVYIQFPSVMH